MDAAVEEASIPPRADEAEAGNRCHSRSWPASDSAAAQHFHHMHQRQACSCTTAPLPLNTVPELSCARRGQTELPLMASLQLFDFSLSLSVSLWCAQICVSSRPPSSPAPPNRLFLPRPLPPRPSPLWFSPPLQPENPLRIHNNGVVDWIKPCAVMEGVWRREINGQM